LKNLPHFPDEGSKLVKVQHPWLAGGGVGIHHLAPSSSWCVDDEETVNDVTRQVPDSAVPKKVRLLILTYMVVRGC
jgi:hypothetical protein